MPGRKKKFIKVAIPECADALEFERAVNEFAARRLERPAETQVAERAVKHGMMGFQTDKGVVSLTADRSFADDVKAGRVPDSVVEDTRRAGKLVAAEVAGPASSEEIQTYNPKYARCINRLR